jgi:hypothetical protein
MKQTQQKFLSQREAAIYLGISKNTLAKYRKSGYFNTISMTKTILFEKKDLDTFNEKFLVWRGKKDPQIRK